jgi:hypothetical protein
MLGVEGGPADETTPGEEVIDVAEYYGGSDVNECDRFRYVQLKHSTVRTTKSIDASEMATTLAKFASIYRAERLRGRHGRLEFVFVANRRLNPKVRLTLQEMTVDPATLTYTTTASILRRYLGFDSDAAAEADFCRRLALDDGVPGMADLEVLLQEDLRQYLPGGGTGTELLQLMDAVSRRATSLVDKQTLTRADVLLALRTTEDELFPAPSGIEKLDRAIVTRGVGDAMDLVWRGPENKIVLTAVGGVGKSVLTTLIQEKFEADGSVVLVYDCFAGGDYRKGTSRRHEHRTALTQLSNELATRGLCAPLIPTQAAGDEYTRVFMRRVDSAAAQLARRAPDAILVVIVDAADNAAMAADDLQTCTFVRDLLREDWPPNARLVELCRPERVSRLDVPAGGVLSAELQGFTKPETLQHLRSSHPTASPEEGDELHALSDGNPRVQAMAMDNARTVAAVLAALQIARDRPGQPLDGLLSVQVNAIADSGHLTQDELSRLCTALATLHPPMPIDDLAVACDVDPRAIRSFAVALGRGFHIGGNTLQFRDEPTETWFRRTYALTPRALRHFAQRLIPLAETSPYVANALPQLLFEAELFDELVELALSDDALPSGGSIQAEEIGRTRARFALAAMLRAGRKADAAVLAVRAGAMSAGHSRKLAMFRANTDLTARFLAPDLVDALCSGRELAGDWPGSNLHSEAALLSHIEQFKDLARGRLRSSINNYVAISRMPRDENDRLHLRIKADDVADLVVAAVNLDGPAGGLALLARWRSGGFRGEIAQRLASRLADAGRFDELGALLAPGKRCGRVRMAVAQSMFDTDLAPPASGTVQLAETLRKRKKPYTDGHPALQYLKRTDGVFWSLVHCLRNGTLSDTEVLALLKLHLPTSLPDSAGSQWHGPAPHGLLLGYALRARLEGRPLSVDDVASKPLRKHLDTKHVSNQAAEEFKENILPLLPWVDCWVATLLDDPGSPAQVERLVRGLEPARRHNPPHVFTETVAAIALRLLAAHPDPDLAADFAAWAETTPTLERARRYLARLALRVPGLEEFGLGMVSRAVEAIQSDRTDADTRLDSLLGLARAVLSTSVSEARAIFDIAVDEAEQVGDDLYARWKALVNSARALDAGNERLRAHRLFQIAEELQRAADIVYVPELADRLRLMHGPSYLAAASRARDRRTLDFGSMLLPTFRHGLDCRSGVAGLVTYAFSLDCPWEPTVDGLAGDDRRRVREVFESFTRHHREPLPQRSVTSRNWDLGSAPDPVNVERTFADSDFTAEPDWTEALEAIGWASEVRSTLLRFALTRHPAARADVIAAFTRSPAARESDFAALASIASSEFAATPGQTRALDDLARTYAVRFALQICTRAHEDKDLSGVGAGTALSTRDVLDLAFVELGRSAHDLRYSDYFYLAGHLATTLSPAEAGDTFDALTSLFDDLAPPHSAADGCYDDLPAPPDSASEALAGLLFAALGDIEIGVRWQAAHAVVLLVRLGCEPELAALAGYAGRARAIAPFVDPRFPFYELHAAWWLLMALERAAADPRAEHLRPFAGWLVDTVAGPPHAVNQLLAQRVLGLLVKSAVIPEDTAVAGALVARVVAEPRAIDDADDGNRPNPLAAEAIGLDRDEDEKRRFRFFYDFERYWCNDVARVFGSTEADVARRAAEVCGQFGGYDTFATDRDPRATAGVYQSGRSHPDHGSWPGQESLSFYMSVHSLLTVGGELARTVPAAHESYDDIDTYRRWLARFLPTRRDGRWLADRRDHPPQRAPDEAAAAANADQEARALWPWSITPALFEEAIGAEREWITVWADVDAVHDDLDEDVSIDTGLVAPDLATPLLVALQTSTSGPYGFRFPTTDDDHDDGSFTPPYEITAWLDLQRYDRGIDQRDPQGGDVPFPPARPGRHIIDRFGLEPDADLREWLYLGRPVLRSRTWRATLNVSNDRESGTRGETLEIERDFLRIVLADLGLTLVTHVGIRRTLHRPYYERNRSKDSEFDYLEFSGKVYLITATGEWVQF